MEILLENNLKNNLNLSEKQNNFLQTNLGKAINNGINIGLRCLLPDYLEDKIIELKDNLLKFGLKEGINSTIKSTIETGKSALGIITGNFENVNQVNEVIKKGGIIDSFSGVFDEVLNKIKINGKIDNTAYKIIKNGKDSILNNIENNIERTLTNQIKSSENLSKYINNWKQYYNLKDFQGMEKEYNKIKIELNNLIPIENTIKNAKNIETIHNLIKNNGQNFNLSEQEIELANKFNL